MLLTRLWWLLTLRLLLPQARSIAVVAAQDAAVAVAIETPIAAAADAPCRHAYRWLHYTVPYRCYDLHVPRFALPDHSES